MSYSCSISFKEIKSEDLYPFLIKFKQETSKKAKDIAVDEYYFSPISKKYPITEIPTKEELNMLFETREWVNKLFTYRWFYRDGLLGVYSVHKSMRDMFDDTIYFQNSCDQDYDFSDWQKINKFKEISDKWQSYSTEKILDLCKKEYGDEDDDFTSEKIEYWRRSLCYDEIWNTLEDTLFSESQVIYLTLYQGYDRQGYDAAEAVMAKHVEYVKELKEKYAEVQ